MYRSLDITHIRTTAETLERRIGERFPESGLRRVAADLLALTRGTAARLAELTRPRHDIRLGVGFLIVLITGVALIALARLRWPGSLGDATGFIQVLESAINDVVFVGIGIAFLVTLEGRIKRGWALRDLRELRSIAHVVDMHQLTKDPDQFLAEWSGTAASPARLLTPAQLTRYLDYCSEMLSLTGKVAALYAQTMNDPVVLAAVNEVEALCTGLSNKIWQKIVLLGTTVRAVGSRE
ncbi:MAG: hypothetical protein ABI587_18300 [Gemmatimonadales bacterium]